MAIFVPSKEDQAEIWYGGATIGVNKPNISGKVNTYRDNRLVAFTTGNPPPLFSVLDDRYKVGSTGTWES